MARYALLRSTDSDVQMTLLSVPVPTGVVSRGKVTGRRRRFLDVLLLSLVACLLAWPSFGWPLATLDESILLVYADQVRDGLVPHRDFFTVYGPAPFYVIAALFKIFGSALEVERAFGLTLHVAIALGCYGIGRWRDRTTGLMAGGLSLILLAPLGSVAYAWLGAMACLVIALALAGRRSPSTDLCAGLAAGLTTVFRPELLLVVIPVMLPFIWRSPRWRWMSGGLALGLVPLGAFVAAVGPRVWLNIGPGRAGVNGSLRLLDAPAQSAVILGSVLCATTMLVWFAWRRRSRVSVSHAILAIGILPQTLQRVDSDHAIYTLCVTAPLVVVGTAATRMTPEAWRRRKLLGASLAAALVACLAALALRSSADTVRVQFGERSAIIEASELPDLLATRSELLRHAPPNGSMFVGSTDMSRVSLSRIMLYHLVPELRPRAYFLELAVGISERAGSGLADDIESADVLLLTQMPEGLMTRLYPYLAPGSDEANKVVSKDFCRVAETPWGVIYRHGQCKT